MTAAAHDRIMVARLSHVGALVEDWDALCSSPFQRRAFLTHLEQTNPCKQRYYELRDGDGLLRAGAVVYTMPLDLLTFSKLSSSMRINFLGVPCSQSAPGLVGERVWQRRLAKRLRLEEPHFLVGLNLDHGLDLPGFVEGRNLPTVELALEASDLDGYLAALRSDYRRRFKKLTTTWRGVDAQHSSCSEFSAEHHALYLDVFARSDAKLEKLGLNFFTQLDPRFALTSYHRDGRLLGWHITLVDDGVCYFLLEGHRGKETEPNVYFNLLVGVLEEALNQGARRVDLGQTAEVPKTRLGGKLVEKTMFATHPSRVVQLMIQRGKGFLEYRRQVPEAHVFKR